MTNHNVHHDLYWFLVDFAIKREMSHYSFIPINNLNFSDEYHSFVTSFANNISIEETRTHGTTKNLEFEHPERVSVNQ